MNVYGIGTSTYGDSLERGYDALCNSASTPQELIDLAGEIAFWNEFGPGPLPDDTPADIVMGADPKASRDAAKPHISNWDEVLP